MNKYVIVLLLCSLVISNAQSQSVSLDSCIQWAYQVQKFSDNKSLIRQSQELAIENDNKMNLPTLVVDLNATYQNENITIATPTVPGFEAPTVPLNFNRLLIQFNQTIYNGRLTAQKKMIDSLTYDTRVYQVEVDKARMKAKITGLYSSIVLVREQKEIIGRQIATVAAKEKQLQGVYMAGAGYKSDLLNLQAEVLNLKQNATDLEYLERSIRQQLSTLTEHQLLLSNIFELPDITIEKTGVEARPELKLITSQKNGLLAQSDMSSASRMPYIGVFGNAGIGYPGYDIFNSSLRPMLLIGLKVNWKLIDWQKSKNDRQLISWNQDILAYQYDRVKLQFETELVKQKQDIEKYEELISRDKEIVALRSQVTKDISARLAGGTATSTDYLIQVNNEAVAELNESIHTIKLALAKITYTIIQGK
jgi:outer membrane protein TolC